MYSILKKQYVILGKGITTIFVLLSFHAFVWGSWTLNTYSEGLIALSGDEVWYAKACPRGKVICDPGKPRILHFAIAENAKAHCWMGYGVFSIWMAALGINEFFSATRTLGNSYEYWGACSLLGLGCSAAIVFHDMWLLWRLKRKSQYVIGTKDTYCIGLKNDSQITGKRVVWMDIQRT